MSRRRRARGYTVVELMTSLGVFAMGVTGIFAMQRLTLNSNQHARNLTLASGIAQGWLSQLSADSSLWRGNGNESATAWLSSVNTSDNVWQLPNDSSALRASRDFSRAFDGRGMPVNPAGDPVFCVHVRLTRLFVNPVGNGLTRTDVRVFWPRDGEARIDGDCVDPGTVAQVAADTGRYHFVYRTGAVRQQP
jgi:hypothetical protein